MERDRARRGQGDKHTRSDRRPVRLGLRRGLLALLGGLLLLVSIPLAILTPFPFIPIGFSVGVAGAALVARNSDAGRALIAKQLNRYPGLQKALPDWLRSLVLGRPQDDG